MIVLLAVSFALLGNAILTGKIQLSTTTAPVISYPTNPFYNPTSGLTTYTSIVHSGGPLVSGTTTDNIGCSTSQGLQDYFLQPSGANTCLYNVGGANPGLLNVPIGAYGDNAPVVWSACGIGIPCATATIMNFGVSLPNNLPVTCIGITVSGACSDVSGFDMKTGVIGTPYLLDPSTCNATSGQCTGDQTCSSFNAGGTSYTGDNTNTKNSQCWASDLQIIQAAQMKNPPCIPGVTVCIFNSPRPGTSQNVTLINPVNGTTTFLNPFSGATKTYNGYTYTPTNCPNKPGAMLVNGNCSVTVNVVSVAQKVWYLYRMVSSIQFQIVPPTITPFCQNIPNNNYCQGGSPNCPFSFTCSDNRAQILQGFAQTAIGNINKVDVMSNTQIAFGVTVPGQAALTCTPADIASGNCWWGIIGLWIGGQGLQTAGCSASASSCSFSPGTSSPHAQLPIYSCPQMTASCSATLPLPSILTSIATATNQTVASVIASQAQGQVFSYINTQNFGVTYACQGGTNCPSCTIGSYTTCFTTPTPVIVNVPLLYDVLGTQQLANWIYQYPAIPPNGGSSTGTIFGYVNDVNGNPIVGACVGIGGLCASAGQYQRFTNSKGLYTFATANLPAGPGQVYSLDASANGYIPQYTSGVYLTTPGAVVEVDFNLNLVPPPPGSGQYCLLPAIPIPNPNPFATPQYTPPLLCLPPIPSWVLPASFAIVGLALLGLIAVTPIGQAAGALGGNLVGLVFRRKRK